METACFDNQHPYLAPTLAELVNLGFIYLTPQQALAARRGKTDNVLLEEILEERLRRINRTGPQGNEHPFTEENIRFAMDKLKSTEYEGPCRTNETIYEQLTLGLSLEQRLDGYARSSTLRYIDWKDWTRNAFHVATQFPVSDRRGAALCLDIVLFVNGIPFVAMECAPPGTSIEQAIAQSIQNQREGHVSGPSDRNSPACQSNFFNYIQLVLATNGHAARFGVIGAPARFWSDWKERVQGETPGARSIRALCRPDRLLELVHKFTVFHNGVRKMARYHQYVAVKRILSHIRAPDAGGKRRSGIVWHTQGSGKSLTMVMLARSLAEEHAIVNPRIVLVTDRKDLDEQIKDTFAACDMAPQRAKTGRDLLELVSERKAGIVTTLVHKFDKALNIHAYRDDSIDIFMLVDESHRTQFGAFAARMRQMFPNACYLGFTGTPLMRKEKNNFAKFGGLIDRYTIGQAIQDNVIVPLLYEGRHVDMHVNKRAIDIWFERNTQHISDAGKARLKRKYATPQRLNNAEKVIYLRALDISGHFRTHWQASGYKGQLIAPGRSAALAYHRYLTEIGLVSSAVIISPPGNPSSKNPSTTPQTDSPVACGDVSRFWQDTIRRYGSEEEYNKQIINGFKYGDDPEILIVVDKLQTGFDAPRNAVLYITRALRGHTLLQTIARVNRVHQDSQARPKAFGLIVDYAGILGELDRALTQYSAFEEFDEEDLASSLVSVREEIAALPRRYAHVRELFADGPDEPRCDEEIHERLLHDEGLQNTFRQRLSKFSDTLDIALANDTFLTDTPPEEQSRYRRERKRFQRLKASIDYRDHEPRIEEMLNTYIEPHAAIRLNYPVHLFPLDPWDEWDTEQSHSPKETYAKPSSALRASVIAQSAHRTLEEHKEWDPAFYDKFSRLIRQVVDDFRAKRLSDVEYLKRITAIRARVEDHEHQDIPESLRDRENALAFYRVLKPYFAIPASEAADDTPADDTPVHARTTHDTAAASEAAIAMDNIFRHHWKVRFWHDGDAIKQVINDVEDYLYDEVKDRRGFDLSLQQMDEIIHKVTKIARYRIPAYGER